MLELEGVAVAAGEATPPTAAEEEARGDDDRSS
jgi:hypothetical protein